MGAACHVFAPPQRVPGSARLLSDHSSGAFSEPESPAALPPAVPRRLSFLGNCQTSRRRNKGPTGLEQGIQARSLLQTGHLLCLTHQWPFSVGPHPRPLSQRLGEGKLALDQRGLPLAPLLGEGAGE
jgi:hypothetical protein